MKLAGRGLLLIACAILAGPAHALTLQSYPPPARTKWRPQGCRLIPTDDALVGDLSVYKNLHANAWNSAEVSLALDPVVGVDWTVETDKWTPTAPAFDRQGNLYFSPVWPGEHVVLIALDAATGARRWAIPGNAPSGSSPLVMPDPDDPGHDVVYLPLYEEAMAVRTDGTVLWRQPSGLTAGTAAGAFGLPPFSFGINYDPIGDALIADTSDGYLYVLDRRSGAPVAPPYKLPGEKAPPATFQRLTPPLLTTVNADLQPLIAGAPASFGWNELVDLLLGGSSVQNNFFSIDPRTGRVWVAATAPDGQDGTIDGVSQFGALYGLDLVTAGGPPYALVEACHVYFTGGSASTPALRPDGTRIYVGDASTHLAAYDSACQPVWTLDVGGQINGNVGVSSDDGELYVSAGRQLLKVIDQETSATIAWTANYDMYAVGAGEQTFHLLLPAIGASALLAQAGGGIVAPAGTPLPLRVGIANLDRETGHVRSYVEGPEESVATCATGPDGGVYLGNSPLRRAAAHALFPATTAPLIGGVTKYGPRRRDLLLRDALCAVRDRAANDRRNRKICPASVEADRRQLIDLMSQSRRTADAAVTAGDLAAPVRDRVVFRVDRVLTRLAGRKLPTGLIRALCRFANRVVGA